VIRRGAPPNDPRRAPLSLREAASAARPATTRARRSATAALEHRFDLDAIAFLLGYADVDSLSRAFRRWAGQPPGAFRHGERAR